MLFKDVHFALSKSINDFVSVVTFYRILFQMHFLKKCSIFFICFTFGVHIEYQRLLHNEQDRFEICFKDCARTVLKTGPE